MLVGMKDTMWQKRARLAGLTQRMIGTLTGRNEKTVGRALSGVRLTDESARPYIAIILAWEIMSEDQREAWLDAVRTAPAD